MTIAEQLTKVYFEEENWHKTRMSWEDAIHYHRAKYENGDIQTYVENGEVLGYYERYILWNCCFFYNCWIRQDCRRGKVAKELKRRFFSTLPKSVTVIIGEKQKLGGKVMEAHIRR